MTKDDSERFAGQLRERLRATSGGTLPRAAEVARRFNQADGWRDPVSAETMRRWILGMCLPELRRLPTLCQVLQCEPWDLLSALDSPDLPANTVQPVGAHDRSDIGRGLDQPTPNATELRQRLLREMAGMRPDELRAVLTLLGKKDIGKPARL